MHVTGSRIAEAFHHFARATSNAVGSPIAFVLAVGVIQNTQNHESRALHLKLDEIIRALSAARNSMVDLEEASDKELARFETEMREIRDKGERS
jgi:low affinity Fe/Cu permease